MTGSYYEWLIKHTTDNKQVLYARGPFDVYLFHVYKPR